MAVHRLPHTLVLTVAAAMAVAAGCGTESPSGGPTAAPDSSRGSTSTDAPVVGTRWVLSRADTTAGTLEAEGVAHAYFQIDDDEVLGSTGCNGFGGSADVRDGTIAFSSVIATKKACSGDLGTLDTAMLSVLAGEVDVDVDGRTLRLTAADGSSLTLEVADEPSPAAT